MTVESTYAAFQGPVQVVVCGALAIMMMVFGAQFYASAGQFYAIFRNTLTETVRQPVYALVLVLSCGLIALSPVFAAHIYTFQAGSGMQRAPERMIADLGLATVLLAGLVLSVFSTASVISREIENRTAITVLSKRVSRMVFVFGKYFGVAVAIGLVAATGAATILLTIRMGAPVAVSDPIDWRVLTGMVAAVLTAVLVATLRNYYRGRPWLGAFTMTFITAVMVLFLVFSVFDKDFNFIYGPTAGLSAEAIDSFWAYDTDVARAAVLTVEAVLVLAGVSLAASTRLGTIGNAAVSGLVFLAGLTNEYFFNWLKSAGDVPHLLGNLGHTAVPNLEKFWMSEALSREIEIHNDYILWTSGYAACYSLALLFFASFLFARREVS